MDEESRTISDTQGLDLGQMKDLQLYKAWIPSSDSWDLHKSNCKSSEQEKPPSELHVQIPDYRHGEKYNDNVADQIEDSLTFQQTGL